MSKQLTPAHGTSVRSCAALTAFALILDWPLPAAVIGGLGLLNLGVMGCQLVGFGRLMHRIIEAVAKQARLIPVESVAPSPLLIRTPRTV